ncbi:SDR family oxidoreductase [Acidiphilium sp. AL]|uniref:SDR family oxidoreductase n=1 Tax=Acidiphilium sp. AL TaxID=2871704 RepID=UPI002916F5AC|nr:SDR family oxidoreductase [Acidiphilium sp. AL]MCU4161821.1 SDR family oxidoreductase [Acidiphilium sp. AL]
MPPAESGPARLASDSFGFLRSRGIQEKQARLRFTTPEQIGALATYLCSDAAQTITGAPPSIDGGWTTH